MCGLIRKIAISKGYFKLLYITVTGILVSCYSPSIPNSQEKLIQEKFKEVADESRIHTWWHWIDGNITKEGICKDLEAMNNQGITQTTILNVGLFNKQFFGLKNIEFDSPEWYEMFKYSLEKADSLGLKIGVHNCDGWSTSGGPWIEPEYAMKEITWSKCQIQGGKYINKTLTEPYSCDSFYRDVAILAIKSNKLMNSFTKAEPVLCSNNEKQLSNLYDGCPVGGVEVTKGDTITIAFEELFEAENITIHLRKNYMWGSVKGIDNSIVSFTLESEIQNNIYKNVADFEIQGFNKTQTVKIPKTKTKSLRLIINNIENTASFFIGELEFLKENELPTYTTDILYHQIKTSSVQGSSENQYYNQGIYQSTPVQFEDIVDLTDKMDATGKLKWDAPAGNWELIRFGYTITGKMNHPATERGKGLECDKMDTLALNIHYDSFPKKLIEHAGKYAGNTFKFLLVDSWECYFQNWTKAFPDEFEKLNGYSLTKWIPVLCGEVIKNSQSTEAFLYDFRRTIAELIETNYYKHFADLCHRDDLELHGEVIYGGSKLPPLDILKAYSYTDMPMYEFWARADKNFLYGKKIPSQHLSKFASSAGFFYEKSVVGSEAYTGYATYSASPWDLKPFGDIAYCSGINQMILHSYVHQPTDHNPGLTLKDFGHSFNRNNTYWKNLSSWLEFQARIQYILQNTNESNDILFYVGDAMPQFNINAESISKGYNYNVCNFDILLNKLHIENHKIKTKEGASFSLLVLPEKDGMNFSTLLRIEELLKEGASIYGKKPKYLNSLADQNSFMDEFIELADKIWGGNDGNKVNIVNYGKGRLLRGTSLNKALKTISLYPDFVAVSSDTTNLTFIHKKNEDVDIYYVANQQNKSISAQCKFRKRGEIVEIWDPITGNISSTNKYLRNEISTTLTYNFKPLESVFFIFRNNDVIDINTSEVKIHSEFEIKDFEGTICFYPAYEGEIKPVKINELKPLTDFENTDIKYFVGKAQYTINFQLPHAIDSTKYWYINLGRFDATADISLNNIKLGCAWSPLQEFLVNNIIKSGNNKLEVNVAVPYRNRFIGDFRQFEEIKSLRTSCEIGKFLNAEMPLKKVGLIDPIRIISYDK